jgi:hypothetical protein
MSREEEGDPGTDVWHMNECSMLELKKRITMLSYSRQ